MKIIVTHDSPDMDAITSIWLIRKFLPGWNEAIIQYVPAGERIEGSQGKTPVEKIGEDGVIHVDTGLGPLDHHQTSDRKVCAASLTWDFVRSQNPEFEVQSDKMQVRKEAIDRIVKVVVDIDHFKEVFWGEPTADFHEFSLVNILEGLKIQKPDQNDEYVDYVTLSLDAILHEFENRIWAEKEIENAQKFDTRVGQGIALETINDSTLKLAQKMGFALTVRKDPRKGYVRIKARPTARGPVAGFPPASAPSTGSVRAVGTPSTRTTPRSIDLTPVYQKLKKMDPSASWFLHVSKKMLLNGSSKNPKMRPTKLSLGDIMSVLKEL